MSQKRTLDAFFTSAPKRSRIETDQVPKSHHERYPFPIANLPQSIASGLESLPARPGREVNNEPDLDLLYFQPYIPGSLATQLFDFLRSELPYYRVEYQIRRGGIATSVRTPRWTTVFGLDETSRFDENGRVVDAATGQRVLSDRRYLRYPPRPMPGCLQVLRRSTEAATGCRFNFCLVNYYASGADSIAFHSDDERFLGTDPAIASFSLGAPRDFLMKHKPAMAASSSGGTAKTIKYPLNNGDMVLMRGTTQSNWLHSIPKRSGRNAEDGGRINITFRRAMVRDGTENYYHYNVRAGPPHRWDPTSRSMKPWRHPG